MRNLDTGDPISVTLSDYHCIRPGRAGFITSFSLWFKTCLPHVGYELEHESVGERGHEGGHPAEAAEADGVVPGGEELAVVPMSLMILTDFTISFTPPFS